MRRAQRQQSVLLIAVAVLAGLVWWTLRHQAATHPPETLLPLAAEAVTHIEVTVHGGSKRVFAKRDGQWWMQSPQQGLANQKHLARLADLADARVIRWRPLSEFDTKQIGLDPPWATVQINQHFLQLGTLSALAPQRYVLLGQHIALIPASYAADIAATPDSELAHAGSTLPTL